MTLSSTTTRADYTGTGTTGPFAFTFAVPTTSDLRVVTRDATTGVETLLVYPTDYSITGVGSSTGGSITLTVALASGNHLTLRRNRPITQQTSLRNQGAYFPESVETALDKLTQIALTQDEQLTRAVSLPETTNGVSASLPTPVANQGIGWNDTATGLENRTLDSNTAALPGSGRTVASLTEFLANNATFNPKDYGAKGDGLADDTAPLQAAINAMVAAGTGVLLFKRPSAYYKVTTLTLPGGSYAAEQGAEIRSLTATCLSITGAVTLRDITATAPTAVAGAKGIDNTGFAVDAAGCAFTGNTNRCGDTATSQYADCTFTSASTLGTTAWSATNAYDVCRFAGQNGADVQGGLFSWCRMVGDGDGVTNGEGWGVHLPLTTASPAPIFDHCYVRGNGLNAYGMGLGNQGRPSLRYCDIEGTKWGLYYRTDSSFTAEHSRIVGGDYGIEFNKVLASPTTVPTTTVTDSFARHCYIDATNAGTNYDLAVPTTSAYGLLYLENCSYGQIVADDALGGATESSVTVIGPQQGWHRTQVKVDAPPTPASGDFYVAGNIATYPLIRMFWGDRYMPVQMNHVGITADRPAANVQPTGYQYYDLTLERPLVRDSTGVWRNLNTELGRFDVTDPRFGAKGDGTTDDTVAIQAAINDASAASPPGACYFPPGNYRTTLPLTISTGGVQCRAAGGQNSATVIKYHTGDAFTVSAGQVEFHDLAIDAGVGTSTTYGTSGAAIHFTGTSPNPKFLGGSINNIDKGVQFDTGAGSGAIIDAKRIAPYTTTVGSEGYAVYIDTTDYLGAAVPRLFLGINTGGGRVRVHGGNDTFFVGCFIRNPDVDANAFNTQFVGGRWGNLGNTITLDGTTTKVTNVACSGPVVLNSTMTGSFGLNDQTGGSYTFTDNTSAGTCLVLHRDPTTNLLLVGKHKLPLAQNAGTVAVASMSADKGDTNATFTPNASDPILQYASALSTARTATINRTGATDGMRVAVLRYASATGNFPLTVQDDAATSLAVLGPNRGVILVCKSGAWLVDHAFSITTYQFIQNYTAIENAATHHHTMRLRFDVTAGTKSYTVTNTLPTGWWVEIGKVDAGANGITVSGTSCTFNHDGVIGSASLPNTTPARFYKVTHVGAGVFDCQ